MSDKNKAYARSSLYFSDADDMDNLLKLRQHLFPGQQMTLSAFLSHIAKNGIVMDGVLMVPQGTMPQDAESLRQAIIERVHDASWNAENQTLTIQL